MRRDAAGSALPRSSLAGARRRCRRSIRFGAAQSFTTPWIAPDEMVYGLIGERLWSNGTLEVRGLPSPYYSVLTPALVGAPLALCSTSRDGIQWARLLQALAASLVAVPTYLWARWIASTGWALAAAALDLAAPALHYAGFLMTEPLTLTVVTAALLALARALEEPTMWRYGVFAAWATAAAAVRLQALVLLPAFLSPSRSTRSPRGTGPGSVRSLRSAASRRSSVSRSVGARRRPRRRALGRERARRVHADRREHRPSTPPA